MKRVTDHTMAEADHVAAFFGALESTRLLEPEQVAELRKQPTATEQDPRPLADLCVEKGWLTQFQSRLLLKGRTNQLVVGPYRLLEPLGEGGMGQVFKAYHQPMNRVVALKFIKTERLKNPQNLRRFKKEVQIAAQLHHPNIVLAYDANQIGDVYYLAMEYVDGVDLNDLVNESGALPVAEACDYIRQAALGLQHAHNKGLVHRDIKPGNLLVTRRGANAGKDEGALVKILDLGLARLGEEDNQTRMTRDGAAMGTPEYMAPEQAINSRNADARSDIYSLGCSFYYLLTGRAPFWGKSLAQLLIKHQLEKPKPLADFRDDVPPALEELLLKLLAKKPEDRPQTAAEVAAALEPFCQGKTRSAEAVLAGRTPKVEENHVWDFLNEIDEPNAKSAVVDRNAATEVLSHGSETRPERAAHADVKKRAALIAWLSGGVSLIVIVLLLVLLVTRDRTDSRAENTGRTPKASNPAPERPKEADKSSDKTKDSAVRPPVEPIKPVEGVKPPPETLKPPPQPPAGGPAAQEFKDGKGPVYALVISPDGRQLFHAGLDQVFVQRDLSTGQVVRFYSKHTGVVHALALSANGKRLLSGGRDASMRLWDTETGEQLREFRGHTTWVYAVAFSPDGTQALSGGLDKSLRVWNLQTGQPVKIIENAHENGVTAAAFSTDGQRIISGGNSGVRVWNIESGKEEGHWKGTGLVHAVVALPNGHVLTGDDVGLHIIDPVFGKEVQAFPSFRGQVFGLAISPDGDRILSACGDSTVRLWDRQTAAEVRRFQGHAGVVWCVAFTPNGRQALSGSSDLSVRIWDLP